MFCGASIRVHYVVYSLYIEESFLNHFIAYQNELSLKHCIVLMLYICIAG